MNYIKMKSLLEQIKDLIKFLPEKDIKYAELFLSNREFDKLKEIVKSDIYLIEHDTQDKYLGINLKEIYRLDEAVDDYTAWLDIDLDYD